MAQGIAGTVHRFFATSTSPCPYLPNRTERKLFTPLISGDPNRLHDLLTASGFRRTQNIAYRPACEGCRSCVPVRVRTRDFHATRSLRRIESRNAELRVATRPPLATSEQFALFHRYQQSRHADSGMAAMDFGDYLDMVEDTTVDTSVAEFRTPDGALAAACLTDRLDDGLSLCYSFFDPSVPHRSLGTYIVLWHVRAAQRLGLPYVYLGYWIAGSSKMAYKGRFRPLEGLASVGLGWRELRVAPPECAVSARAATPAEGAAPPAPPSPRLRPETA